MNFELPRVVIINDEIYQIRADFRDILRICMALQDDTLSDDEKLFTVLYIFYERQPHAKQTEAAVNEALKFIDGGDNNEQHNNKIHKKIIDWEQDFNLYIPAINKVAGFEVRNAKFLHWWTFLGYFQEIGECLFSHIVNLRSKKAKREKLTKEEQQYWAENRHLLEFTAQTRNDGLTEEQKEFVLKNWQSFYSPN